MDDLIKLIDLSLEDGKLDPDDYLILLKKAQIQGLSEEEFNLILSKRTKHFFKNNSIAKRASNSKLPYILAIVAIAATFLDWFGAYSKSSAMGSSANWDYSFNGWWGGYGAAVILIYALGSYFYFKGNRFFWLAGLLAIADAIYVYSTLTSANVSFSYDYEGYGGSAEAGYKLLWGFWLFVFVSGVYTLSAFFVSGKHIIKSKFRHNFRSGRLVLLITSVVYIPVVYFITKDPHDQFSEIGVMLIVFSIAYCLIILLIYIFSPSAKVAGYVLFGISAILYAILAFTANGEFIDIENLLIFFFYPVSYIVLDRIMVAGKRPGDSIGVIGILLFVSTLNLSCSEGPKMKSRMVSSENMSGTYSLEFDGFESSLTVIGTNWFGTLTEIHFGNLISSGSGFLDGNKIYNDYGIEIGYISEGTASVNIGGMELTLRKE